MRRQSRAEQSRGVEEQRQAGEGIPLPMTIAPPSNSLIYREREAADGREGAGSRASSLGPEKTRRKASDGPGNHGDK
ncbi:hypothetical protein NHX12_002225 [Muraenolepis orangiensis]|uniref:Uncharacterized protein n=1 Tax=Muraenolepis orangiensis TaxID=630683 RepID=A0A9Q0IG69_9TELE|nr:hypothetical protein NHX12_002225 [Muraenolepis orangiensis]